MFADGASVRVVGTETFRICEELVDEMITVSTDEICAAIKTAFNDTRSVLEPAGALGIAGMEKYIGKYFKRKRASIAYMESTVVKISIPPLSFKLVSLFLLRLPLF